MGRVALLKRISSALKAFRSDAGFADKWYEVYPGIRTMAGTQINETSALTISALFAALNFLASTMATFPKVILRRLPGGGREHAFDHPLYDRLHNKVNDWGLPSWQWIYTSIMHKYLWGNWYTYLDRKTYQNQQLIPLLPERMVKYDEEKELYVYRLKSGLPIYLPKSQVLHIPHISEDGINGKGIIHYARESLGIAKAQDEFAATFFGSGIHAGGFVEVEKPMEEDTRQGLQKDFNEKYGGLGRIWKAIFMTGGAKFQESEIDAQKAQALESRQFSVVEIARWMNLPPHILRDLVRATFSNIEEQSLELVVYSLLPLATQIEQYMNIALFDDTERRTHYVKFELKGLLRGDLKTRTEFYKAMADRGIFNADMVLELEDINPQPDGLGQVYMVPLNMVNKETIISPQSLTIENKSGILAAKRTMQIRSAALRRRLTIAYRPKFEQFAKQLVKKEVGAVRKALKEMLTEHGIADFSIWLDDFYRDFPKEIDKIAAPTISSYATAILPIAQDEAGSEDEIGLEYGDFQRQYREKFAQRHVISSHEQLKSVIREAQTAGTLEIDALEQHLDEWEERRPGKIVMRESVQAENAFTRSAFALCGIMKIMSVSYGKSCPYCNDLDGKVIGIEENFLSPGDFQPEGAERPLTVTSDHKHPPYHGGCLPGYSRILAEGVSSASKRWYDGNLVIIHTSRGHKLAVTSNHPILTSQGWINSDLLNVGDYVISNVRGQRIQFGNGNGKNIPSRIENIAETLLKDSQMIAVPVPTTAKDFHGDGKNSKVAIVGTDRLLWDIVYSPLVQQGAKLSFGRRYTGAVSLPRLRSKTLFGKSLSSAGSGKVGRGCLSFPFLRRQFTGPNETGFAARTPLDPGLRKMTINHAAVDSKTQSEAINRLAGQIAPDKIIGIKRNSFHGYVFNLQTKYEFYFADNIIAHNCDCGIAVGV